MTANAMWREPEDQGRASDPGDDHLWSLLQVHPGAILITGDRLLLEAPPADASVISARTWLDQFAASG
ncbi:MAG: hypothetical protein U5O39_12440 [Gammaproteobacteria bacterium]|nr:hypothetical protein [Gammaproteobacteria bacterium]